MIYSLDLSMKDGLLLLLVVSLIVTIVLIGNNNSNFVGTLFLLNQILDKKKLSLFIVRWIHTLVVLFNLCYIFVFNKKYDIIYICFLSITIMHWFFLKNECVLSYIEKKIIDKNYKLGSDLYSHPFTDKIFSKKIKHLYFFTQFCLYIYVCYRFFSTLVFI